MKTKALISFAVTAKLICVFVFAYAKIRFSHDAAHIRTPYFRIARDKRTAKSGQTGQMPMRAHVSYGHTGFIIREQLYGDADHVLIHRCVMVYHLNSITKTISRAFRVFRRIRTCRH